MLERVHGVLGPAHAMGDLPWRHTAYEAEHDDLALLLGHRGQSDAECLQALPPDILGRAVGVADLLARHRTPRPDVIDRGVVGHADDPRLERHRPWLVRAQRVR